MIPKVIHYCWFGGKDMPRTVEKMLATWRASNPDFEIRRHDESNFDIEAYPYAKSAYEVRNYAFVSDVARLEALVEEGGIYLDTDVECVRGFAPLLSHKAFLGFEGTRHVSTATMGCEAHHPLFEEFLKLYSVLELTREDGSVDSDTNVLRLTRLLERHGLRTDGTKQEIAGVTIYPPDYFSPYDYVDGRLRKSENTYSIHWYSQSWLGISSLRRMLSIMYHRLRGIRLE